MQQVFSPPQKLSLNNDIISVVCQFLDLEDTEINKRISLVNKECYKISCSDKYWSRIIQKWEESDHEKDFIGKLKDSKKDSVNWKKTYINTKRRHYFLQDFNKKCGCDKLLWVLFILGTVLLLIFIVIFMSAIMVLRPIDYCSRQVNELSRERVIDSIPLNGSCIHCNNSTSYNSLPLLECQFNSSSNSSNNTTTTNTNPISFPCCFATKYGEKCVYDTIISNRLKIWYKIDLSTTEKIYESSVYECIVGSCDAEKLTNYTRFWCHPYQKTYTLNNQSNVWTFPLLISISFLSLIVGLFLSLISEILFYFTSMKEDFLPIMLEKDLWFKERIEDGIVYIQPKKDICCFFFLKYLKFLSFNIVTLNKEESEAEQHNYYNALRNYTRYTLRI